ncbi:MAG: MFS transporter, partial [Gammaproteobacteria bacterium]|nr:MFS transporter [Gammaproteobacteria bacterium]
CLGLGSAFSMPAWAALIPEVIPRPQLKSAITLNALAMNVSRAVGPALAGFLIADVGPGPVFLLNAASFLGILAVLKRWKRPPRESSLPAERLLGAMRAGLRYARHSPALLRIVIRIGAFFTFASAPWALLPLLVRTEWHGGPADYGLMLAAIGSGAIVSVFLLPRLRRGLADDWLVGLGSLLYAVTLMAMAVAPDLPAGLGAAAVAGAAWLIVMTTLQGAAQVALPAWVRARGLSLAMVAMMAGMAGGSLVWGQVAGLRSIPDALLIAGIGLAVATLLTLPLCVGGLEKQDLTPSLHWPSPVAETGLEHDSGPVLVTLAYRVKPESRAEFRRLMKALRKSRRRDGAYYWQLFRDTADPDWHLETFLVESWVEHLRQHERVTVEDRRLQDRVHGCLAERREPLVSHWIAETG